MKEAVGDETKTHCQAGGTDESQSPVIKRAKTTHDTGENLTRGLESIQVDDTACCEQEQKEEGNFPDRLVPQLASHGITETDLRTAARVLNAVAALNHRRKNKRNRPKKREGDADVDDISADNTQSQGTASCDDEDGLSQYQHPNLRPLRKALAGCFDLHKRILYNGKSEEQHFADRLAERTLKRQKMSERVHQKKYIAETKLRRGRIDKLERLKEEAKEEVLEKMKMLVPDGHVDTMEIEGKASALLLKDASAGKVNEGAASAGVEDSGKESITLPKLRSCYVCKVRFRELHHFYDQLCPSCADINFSKRHFSVSLENKVAVVTGSRVKIGFQTCLKLLRAGCTVVATTRFPNSAAKAYQREKDFDKWKGNLHVYGLDLRDVTGLEAFTRFLKVLYGERGVDILINNACQTVRRPRGYYNPMVSNEQEIWKDADDAHKSLLGGCIEFERVRRKLVIQQSQRSSRDTAVQLERGHEDTPLLQIGMEHARSSESIGSDQANGKNCKVSSEAGTLPSTSSELAKATKPITAPFESTGLSHSAAMTQMVILPEDLGVSSSVLPPGVSDINGQQLDLRTTNSWLLKMDEVSTPEVMECMLINSIAPFVLNSRLKPLMATPEDNTRPDRYIINVSAMEGKFYRYKMPNHPHTNMAKAALNMLTRTSSEDLAKKHRIFMNSVDTGWINDENPLEKASKIAQTNLFQTPIDEIDAAARILDPIFVGVAADQNGDAGVKKEYGKFFKDYRETEW